MENLLAMPVRPVEVMIAKIVPHIGIGYVQVILILAVSVAVFQLPIRGSIGLLLSVLGLFIASNLAFRFTISTIARNHMQAIQLAQFTPLPSILLSGFLYPPSDIAVNCSLRLLPCATGSSHRARQPQQRRLPNAVSPRSGSAISESAAVLLRLWFQHQSARGRVPEFQLRDPRRSGGRDR